MASICDIHNISYTYKSEIKHDSRETDDRYVVPKLTLSAFPYYAINRLLHRRRFETHT